MSIYAWSKCSHEGIGRAGCPVCDPDQTRVRARYERLLSFRFTLGEVREIAEDYAASMVEWKFGGLEPNLPAIIERVRPTPHDYEPPRARVEP